MLARRRAPARLLLLGTYRPAEVMGRDHPLRTVTQDLRLYEYGAELPLELLSAPAVAAYLAARLPGGTLPVELGQCLYERTGGNPLFVVKVVEHLITRGMLVEQEGHWELRRPMTEVAVEIPENLRQMIAQQLDRLTPEEQQLVEVGSVRGIEFSVAVVAAGLEQDGRHLESVGEALVRRGAVLRSVGAVEWPDGTFSTYYAFQHALYQQVAYERLGMARRVMLHRRIGERLEQAYGGHGAALAAELAMHFERGRDYPRAVRYLQQAAETALQRHAHQEAVDHLRHALTLLSMLPDTPERPQQELQLRLALPVP